ncbi:DUF4177 domain-containing protein [bacterium]|nr:DUF4177 domain-containing protein [bacterium]
MIIRYKVVETQIVTDEIIEGLINSWVDKGWLLDGIRFAMSDASRRPSMAFILFTREGDTPEEEDGGRDGEGS